MTKVTRRDFIKTASLMGGVSLFAGCSLFGSAPQTPEYIKGAPGVDPIESLRGIKSLFSVCNLCNGKCGICCRTAQGAVVKIGGSPYHPVSKGDPLSFDVPSEQASLIGASICAIGSSGIQTLYDPFRVAKPLKRVGQRGSGKWKSVSWSEAFSEITNGGDLFGEGKIQGLRTLKDAGEGFGFLAGEIDWGSLTFIKGFLDKFPGAKLFRDDNALAQEIVKSCNRAVFGNNFGDVHPDYGAARLLINFGSAPLDSGVPLVSTAREIANARASLPGMKWVVIDPRQSVSAAKADLWIPIIPGKDLSFTLAVMKAIYDRYPQAVKFTNESITNVLRKHSVSEYADDAGSYEAAAVEVARYLAEAGPLAAVIPGAGVYGQENGRLTAEAVLALNLVIGSNPWSGGLTYCDESYFLESEKNIIGPVDQRVSKIRPLAPCKALFIWGSDPLYSSLNFESTISNVKDLPLVVAISPVISQTASMADFILPDTTYLERWDVCSAPSMTSSKGFGLRSPVVGGLDARNGRYFPILQDSRLMEDILYKFSQDLSLGFGKELAVEESPSISRAFYYKAASEVFNSYNRSEGKTDIGSVTVEQMFERGGYFQKSSSPRKIDMKLVDFSANPSRWGECVRFDRPMNNEFLTLITYSLPFHRSAPSSVNSWLREILPENRLIINPVDASARGLKQGDIINLESSEGKIRRSLRIQIAPGIRPGVVALANGFGYRGSGATPYSIDKSNEYVDKPRSAGVNSMEFMQKGSLVLIRKT